MKNYLERLNKVLEDKKEFDYSIDDITSLYNDFNDRFTDRFNFIYKKRIKPFLQAQFKKRVNKPNFNKKLFSKILFNNLYQIRQDKDDKIPFYAQKGSDTYLFYASHQYIRRELEKLTIDQIILLSYELVKHFKKCRG